MRYVVIVCLFISWFVMIETDTSHSQNQVEYFDSAINKIKMGNYIGAIEEFNKSIAVSTNNVLKSEAYANIASINNLKNQFQKAIEADKLNIKAYVEKGVAQFQLKDTHSAIEDFNLALILNKNNTRALVGRALCKSRLGDYDGAITDFSLAISTDPNSKRDPEVIKAYLGRGISKIKIGQTKSGCDDIKRAGEMGNKNAYNFYSEYCQ